MTDEVLRRIVISHTLAISHASLPRSAATISMLDLLPMPSSRSSANQVELLRMLLRQLKLGVMDMDISFLSMSGSKGRRKIKFVWRDVQRQCKTTTRMTGSPNEDTVRTREMGKAEVLQRVLAAAGRIRRLHSATWAATTSDMEDETGKIGEIAVGEVNEMNNRAMTTYQVHLVRRTRSRFAERHGGLTAMTGTAAFGAPLHESRMITTGMVGMRPMNGGGESVHEMVTTIDAENETGVETALEESLGTVVGTHGSHI